MLWMQLMYGHIQASVACLHADEAEEPSLAAIVCIGISYGVMALF